MCAAQEGHSEVVSFLLENGAHVEAANEVRRDHIYRYEVIGDYDVNNGLFYADRRPQNAVFYAIYLIFALKKNNILW